MLRYIITLNLPLIHTSNQADAIMKIRRYLTATVFAFLTSFHAQAANLDAHTHGIAILTVAVENNAVEIEFESPAANIVGFEHKAKSHKQEERVHSAEDTLKNTGDLFTFNSANCSVKAVSVDVSSVLNEDDHGHADHKEHAHHDHHEEHSEHAHDDHHSESNHSEITASYQFKCAGTNTLDSITIDLFSHFHGIEELDVMWITAEKQGASTLRANRKSLTLK